MSDINEIHRDLGRLEGTLNSLKPGLDAKINALEARLEAQNEEIASMRQDIRALLAFSQEARGSWKTLMAMSGFAAVVGGLLTKFLPYLVGK